MHENIRIHSRPAEPLFHSTLGKHRHGGENKRIGLLLQKLYRLRDERIGHDIVSYMIEIRLIEFGGDVVGTLARFRIYLKERLPENIVVGLIVLMNHHSLNARVKRFDELGSIQSAFTGENADSFVIVAEELVDIHRQQRTVKIKTYRLVRLSCITHRNS